MSNEWNSLPADGYSTILSDIDDKGVISATVVIDQAKLSDITGEPNFFLKYEYIDVYFSLGIRACHEATTCHT